MALNLRTKQIDALRLMLNLNQQSLKNTNAAETTWKILVYDHCGQDILSPLLSVKELRELGVTLHLLISSEREPIPDVPVVYFVQPTDENIQFISKDLEEHLYDSYYFNFISPISRHKLEDLARVSLQTNSVGSITKVYDQYLNFITLEDDLFMLRHHNQEAFSYYALNRGDIKDTEMENIIESISDSLFSMLATLGMIPIIRSPQGNAAEMVAERLDKKLRENLRDTRNSLFTSDNMHAGQFSFHRPLLVILDRNLDMTTPLHHTWTYQALAHDVLKLELNRVTIEDGKAAKKPKTFDLNTTDKFWEKHKGSPFPLVAEAVQEELESYRNSEDEVKRLKAQMGFEGEGTDEAMLLVSDSTNKLTSAVSSLPELLERKRGIDLHTTLATSVLDHIKARKLDVFFELEEKIISKQTPDQSLLDFIADPDAGELSDKMRLFLIHYLCSPSMTDAEIDSYLSKMEDGGASYIAALKYLKRWKSYSKMALNTSQYSGGGTKTVSMFSRLMTHGSQFVMEGVKNLVIKKHNLPITRVVDALMELKSLQDIEDYRYFDPKVLRITDSSNIPRSRSPFQNAIVFVVGGGNYIEYQNLVDYSKGKQIVYGCSNLMTSSGFLEQLKKLGEDMQQS